MLAIVLAVGAVLSASGSSSVSQAASSDARTLAPSVLRRDILTAAGARTWLHYVSLGRAHDLTQTAVGDVSADRGVQHVSFRLFGNRGHFTILVLDHTAYLRGDVNAFSFWGFPSQADKYVGRWITVPDAGGDQIYKQYADDVTLGSFLADHIPRKNLALTRANVGREKAVGLRGKTTAPGLTAPIPVELWLDVRSDANPLPLRVRQKALTNDFVETTTIGPWNRPVDVQAPADTAAFRRIFER